MTKAKAKKLMLDYSRNIIQVSLAQKITKAFGLSLKDLSIEPQTTRELLGDFAPDETANLKGVSTYVVAQSLAREITGQHITSKMNGRGSSADDITSKCVELLN